MLPAIFAFLHHVAAFTLVSTVVAEFLLARDEINLTTARKLVATDLILGISAAVLLIVGVLFRNQYKKSFPPNERFSFLKRLMPKSKKDKGK